MQSGYVSGKGETGNRFRTKGNKVSQIATEERGDYSLRGLWVSSFSFSLGTGGRGTCAERALACNNTSSLEFGGNINQKRVKEDPHGFMTDPVSLRDITRARRNYVTPKICAYRAVEYHNNFFKRVQFKYYATKKKHFNTSGTCCRSNFGYQGSQHCSRVGKRGIS